MVAEVAGGWHEENRMGGETATTGTEAETAEDACLVRTLLLRPW